MQNDLQRLLFYMLLFAGRCDFAQANVELRPLHLCGRSKPLPYTATNSLRRFQHCLSKHGVAAGGVVNEDVGDGADELAVLNNGATAH